jgi:Ran GTPase-activating protein (RanGAP) involved in mRNA processing and transport
MRAEATLAIVLLASGLAPSWCGAGGTVGLADVDPLLRQKPALRSFLRSSLDLNETVMAAVRFGPHLEHLGGARMGPYMIEARPKGAKDGRPLEVVLCTDARFLDESGKVVESEMTAVRVEERLTTVMLREFGATPAIPSCPGE